ncbi:hypothetical protein BU16DRAFT_554613 [Lophium mytilinum]|uniref:Uncharacterized protein n=1 Tax=Lophium mytilinum TaxID=390894 RepID=A0A6A6RCG2_9PEZI|nr:hypothetical protein BU16DRAFT_554613 [Lophium mytilinum]
MPTWPPLEDIQITLETLMRQSADFLLDLQRNGEDMRTFVQEATAGTPLSSDVAVIDQIFHGIDEAVLYRQLHTIAATIDSGDWYDLFARSTACNEEVVTELWYWTVEYINRLSDDLLLYQTTSIPNQSRLSLVVRAIANARVGAGLYPETLVHALQETKNVDHSTFAIKTTAERLLCLLRIHYTLSDRLGQLPDNQPLSLLSPAARPPPDFLEANLKELPSANEQLWHQIQVWRRNEDVYAAVPTAVHPAIYPTAASVTDLHERKKAIRDTKTAFAELPFANYDDQTENDDDEDDIVEPNGVLYKVRRGKHLEDLHSILKFGDGSGCNPNLRWEAIVAAFEAAGWEISSVKGDDPAWFRLYVGQAENVYARITYHQRHYQTGKSLHSRHWKQEGVSSTFVLLGRMPAEILEKCSKKEIGLALNVVEHLLAVKFQAISEIKSGKYIACKSPCDKCVNTAPGRSANARKSTYHIPVDEEISWIKQEYVK